MNTSRTILSIERENAGCICIACGALYGVDEDWETKPGCAAEAPHYKYALEWPRAYQAGPEWRALLPVAIEHGLSRHHEMVMRLKLPALAEASGD